MGAEGAPLSDGGRGRAGEAGAVDAVAGASAPGGGGASVSSGEALVGGAVGDPPDGGPDRGTASTPAGKAPTSSAHAFSDPGGDALADGTAETGGVGPAARKRQRSAPTVPGGGPPTDDQSADGPADADLFAGSPVNDLPAEGSVGDGLAAAGDDDGGGVSPVVCEYVEGLRREALARDAQLRARGIDPYKGAGVDEGPRRRLGARVLVVLVVLVAAVSVGAYVVFFHGEPDYGMSHGYQVQSDGSLKRPPVTDKAPVQPAEMSAGGEAGAKAAARYYLKARAYAWNTGDTGPAQID